MRKICRAALGALMALLVLAATAAAAGPAPVTPGSRYLALGDSVVFGYEESQVVPAPNYSDAASFVGYPEFVASALHLKVANAACPGETSGSFINAKAQSNGCENPQPGSSSFYRQHPLHVRYTGSQLAFAVKYLKAHPDTRLVTLMIGANDLLYCEETTRDACTSPSEYQPVFATAARNIRTILAAIRNRAHYRGQLVLVSYYSLNYAIPLIDNIIRAGDQSAIAAARPFHVTVADGYAAFKAAALHSGGVPCAAGLFTQVGAGKCGVHPSYAGQALLASTVEKVVKLG